MRKFVAILHTSWQNTVAYRLESLMWLVLEIMPVLVMTSLWIFLESTGQISATKASGLVFYYTLSLLISRLASIHFDEWYPDEIKNGKINSSLLRPFPLKSYLLAHSIVHRFQGFIYTIPIFIFLFPYYQSSLFQNVTLIKALFFLTLIVIAFLQKFLVSWLISLCAFWFDQVHFLSHLKWMLEGVAGGAWLPLTFFPLWWQDLVKYTPFYYWFFFPIQTLTSNTFTDAVSGTLVSLLWLGTLYVLAEVVWKKGVKKYSSSGG